MLISELQDRLSRGGFSSRLSKLRDMSIEDQGLVVGEADPVFLDDLATDKLAKFLGIPTSYIDKVPAELKRLNLNYLLHNAPEEAEAVLRWSGDNLTGVFPADKRVVPVNDLAARLATVFSPEDEVVRFVSDDKRIHMDVLVQEYSVNVPAQNKSYRPVGDDITHGGIRLIGSTNPNDLPALETYFHRLVCSNGASVKEPDQQITLRGNTVDEVMDSLEQNARILLAGLPNRLEQYKATDEIVIEANIEQTIRQLAQEQKIADRVTMKVIEAAAELPPVDLTSYELLNLFNQVANMSGVSYSSQIKLQSLSGEIATEHSLIEHRCGQCSRVL